MNEASQWRFALAQQIGQAYAENRLYLPNPGFKSMDELIAEMRLAPADLSARLKQAFRLPPLEGVQHLHKVIEDIFVLVETHMPEFDTALYREKVRCTRFGQLIARPRVRRCSRNERSQAT